MGITRLCINWQTCKKDTFRCDCAEREAGVMSTHYLVEAMVNICRGFLKRRNQTGEKRV